MTNPNFTREVWGGITGGAPPGSGRPSILRRWWAALSRRLHRPGA